MQNDKEKIIFDIAQNWKVNITRTELIQQYLTKVKAANKEHTELKAFKDLLNSIVC